MHQNLIFDAARGICRELDVLFRMKRADRLQEPCDLPAAFEARSVMVADENDWLNLATTVLSKHGLKNVVLADVTGQQTEQAIGHLSTMGRNIKVEKIKSIAQLKDLAASKHDDTVTIAALDEWHTAAPGLRLLDANDTMVLILLDGKSIKRRDFAHYLGILPPENCIIGFIAD